MQPAQSSPWASYSIGLFMGTLQLPFASLERGRFIPSKQIRNLTYSYYIPRRNIIRLVLEEPESTCDLYRNKSSV